MKEPYSLIYPKYSIYFRMALPTLNMNQGLSRLLEVLGSSKGTWIPFKDFSRRHNMIPIYMYE